MACSSSSSSLTLRNNYDVFISFRGKDTRLNFTDHLFGALQTKQIFAFRDDRNLKKGESIAPELLLAIEGSQVFVVIFSKNYAFSTWCLRELEKILDYAQVSRKRILPIFFDVDPSEIRHQKGSFAEAFEQHNERYNSEIVLRWREALTQVANLSGYDIRDKPQHGIIQEIVDEIIDILDYKLLSLPNDFVGISTPIKELEKLLQLDLVDDVRVVGISGMGGIGKTTLASVLYGRISRQFNASCFIDDISRVYRQDGPIGAQKQILYQTQGGEHVQINNHYDGVNLIRSRLRRQKALIILDNVDHFDQLEKIALSREWLGAGSRMIIISRDAHLLQECGVDANFKVSILNENHAYQLFCQKAFKCDNIMSDKEKLINEILSYADGLPIAIKVLASFLNGRNVSEWRSALARLKKGPDKRIMDVLQLSFDGLDEMEKDIFLDIACFFNGHMEAYVRNVLSCCGFDPDIGLRVLIDKSLITIRYVNGLVQMHSLLQELGKNIVLGKSIKEHRKWSRMWLTEHLDMVMSKKMEKKVEAIVLGEVKPGLMAEALSKMHRLRLLIVNSDVKFSGRLIFLSSELRYICWEKCPFMYLPSSFQPNQLVELVLQHSHIRKLWEDNKSLPKLKTLDLSGSKNLIKLPNFEKILNLENLILEECVKLVDMEASFGLLRKLVILNLKGCKNLRSIPSNVFRLNPLKHVNLSGCSKIFINLLIIEMPSTMKRTMLPSFSCLCELDISFCGLSKMPQSIGYMRGLKSLKLSGNNFVTLPSLKELSKLGYLNLSHCKQLKSLPEIPSHVNVEKGDNPRFIYGLGLRFFNCPKLGESERSDRLILSWMAQFIQAFPKTLDYIYRIDTVIPGSEIPRWFNNRSVGNSPLHVSIPTSFQDINNFPGFAFCVVFSVAPGDSTIDHVPLGAFSGCLLTIKSYNCNIQTNQIGIYLDEEDIIPVTSNHKWLCNHFNWPFGENVTGMKVSVDTNSKKGLPLEVKNFGCRLVSNRDLQMMHCENLLDQKQKFLAIEDEAQPEQ